MNYKTIAAISTPLGPGGIGIIRISGSDAYRILKTLFIRNKQHAKEKKGITEMSDFCSHFVYYGFILHPESKNIIDEVLVIYMKGPKSFTKEDVVEIHSHSGFVVLDRILSVVIDAGAKIAEPGEFTKRAFLNGRIDLSQAEAVIDLINAPCETAAAIASQQVAGGFKDIVENISQILLELQAKCEAEIEFSDDGQKDSISFKILKSLEEIIYPEIKSLIAKQKETAIFKDGLHITIGGMPNVGKSSLLNQLVDNETAIVSELPGTTRDIVREYISISGVPVVIYDTAGIHDTKDPVECIGIEKAKNQINSSDIVLWVLDGTREMLEEEKRMIGENRQENTIVVINKKDIAFEPSIAANTDCVANIPHILISAKYGQNIDRLKKLIFKEAIKKEYTTVDDHVSPNLRQRKILEKILQELKRCSYNDNSENSLEVLSEIIRKSRRLIEQIAGRRNNEDLYDSIFSQFCIGK